MRHVRAIRIRMVEALFFLMGLSLLFIWQCQRLDLTELEFIEIQLLDPIPVSLGVVKLEGSLLGLPRQTNQPFQPSVILDHGFLYNSDQGILELDAQGVHKITLDAMKEKGRFDTTINLPIDQTYFLRAYALVEGLGQPLYSTEIKQFSFGVNVYTLKTWHLDNNDLDVEGFVTGLESIAGGFDHHGHVYASGYDLPILGEAHSTDLGQILQDQPFISHISGLVFNTAYTVRAYSQKGDLPPVYGDTVQVQVLDGWQVIKNPNLMIHDAVAVTMDSMAYVGLGCGDACGPFSNVLHFWKFEPGDQEGSGEWTQMAPFEGEVRINAVAFTINKKIYYGLGAIYRDNGTVSYPKDLWQFNPEEGPIGKWETIGTFPAIGREGAVVFVLENNKAYLGTGYNKNIPSLLGGEGFFNDFYVFDPENADIWDTLPPLPGIFRNQQHDSLGRREAIAAVANNTAYVGFGEWFDESISDDLWQWKVDNKDWEKVNFFPGFGRKDAVTFTINEKIYISTGKQESQVLADCFQFNPEQKDWIKMADFKGGPRWKAVGFTLGQRAYMGGGLYDLPGKPAIFFSDFWKYIPVE